MSLPEVSRRLALPKSSVHCLLLTLARRGYLHRNEKTNRYMFASNLFILTGMALPGIELRQQAAPFTRELMEKTSLTVHLAILEHEEAVVIGKVQPPGIPRLATWLGKRMDVHCTGVGKALIAFLPEEELNLLIREHGLPRHNENTIGSARKLKEDLARVRRLGYSTDDEEDEIGLRCIGAPIFDYTGNVVATVSVSGTTLHIRAENLSSLAARVRACAAGVSRVLGSTEIR